MQVKQILFDSSFEKKFQKYKNKLTEKELNNLKVKFAIFKENIFNPQLECIN